VGGGGLLVQNLNTAILLGNDTKSLFNIYVSLDYVLDRVSSLGASCCLRTFSFTKPAHWSLVSCCLHISERNEVLTLRAFLLVRFRGSREN